MLPGPRVKPAAAPRYLRVKGVARPNEGEGSQQFQNTPNKKLWLGFAHLFRPTYAWANVGHPSCPCGYLGSQSFPVELCGIPHPRFPVKVSGFREPYAPFLKERRTRCLVQCHVQEIRGISRKTSEIWGTPGFVTGLGVVNLTLWYPGGSSQD
jgi:hypothetical protein